MRTQKAFMNMTTSMLAQIIIMICGLITPRLILTNFGSTYNGIINSAVQFLSIVSVLRLGIAGATRVALYKTLAVGDVLGTSRIMKATKQYMRRIAYIIVAYAVVLMFVYPLISHNNLSRIDCAMIVGIVSISTFAEYFFGISNLTLLSADQSEYVSNIFNSAAVIANTLLTMLTIRLGANIFTVKLSSAVVFLITPLLLNIYVIRKYRLIYDCEVDTSAIKDRGSVAFHSVANIVHDNTDIILLTLFTDVKMVSVYTVYYMIVSKLKSILQIFTGGMEAVFGNMWVKKEYETLDRAFHSFEFLIYSFTTVVFSCTGLLILSFVGLYTKGVTDVQYIRPDFAMLIVLTETVFCLREPYLLLVQATGSYKETKNGAMLEAAVNLVSSIIFVQIIGINGVIIGTLLANIIRTTQYMVYASRKILNRNIKEVVFRVLMLFLQIGIIVMIGLWFDGQYHIASSWFGWLVNAAIDFAVAIIVVVIFGALFFKAELMYLMHKVMGIVRRKRL